jgi:transcriptional regulator with XRE-family HTH domain
MSDFATILREKRHASGLSQRHLAERVGVDFSYISKLENGRLPAPSAETIVRLSEVLGCPSEDLLSPARKLTTAVENGITSEPAALRFLDDASKLKLSADEWEHLRGTLHGLRSNDKGGS